MKNIIILRRISADESKPPLGLKPKFVHDAQRVIEIEEAIRRYLNDTHPIPIEWVNEYNDLLKKSED